MVTRRQPGGYIDNDLLNQATGRNTLIAGILAQHAEIFGADRRLAGPMIRVACLLNEQKSLLTEMQAIREQARVAGSSGANNQLSPDPAAPGRNDTAATNPRTRQPNSATGTPEPEPEPRRARAARPLTLTTRKEHTA